jgi:hypothetical protein
MPGIFWSLHARDLWGTSRQKGISWITQHDISSASRFGCILQAAEQGLDPQAQAANHALMPQPGAHPLQHPLGFGPDDGDADLEDGDG